MYDPFNPGRRQFFGAVAMTVAAAQLSALAQSQAAARIR
jgi:hypothetical protein